MFTIIGGDGKEYGPVSADQIHAWIAAGRANLDTQARAAGSAEWRRVGDYPEIVAPTNEPPTIGIDDSQLADLGSRLGAAIIDRVCAVIVALPGVFLLGTPFLNAVVEASRGGHLDLENIDTARVALGGLALGAGLLALTIVQIWLIWTLGQSIGKRIIGIRIVLARDGGHPGFVHGWALRNLIPGIISFVPWLGMLFVLVDTLFIFGPERRCVHDYIAGTKVVKA